MRLRGVRGDRLGLDLLGYEFPVPRSYDPGGSDENWLLVKAIVTFKGRTWEASDPCLLTAEVEALATWFREAAREEPPEQTLWFTEPNLEFGYVGHLPGGVSIRAGVGWELSPDPAPRTPGGQVYLTLDGLSQRDLVDAADSLDDQLSEYPPRGLWRSFHYGLSERPRT